MYFRTVFITFCVSLMSVIYTVDAERYVPEHAYQNGALTHLNPTLSFNKVFFQSTEQIVSSGRWKRNVNKYEIPVSVLHDDVTQKAKKKQIKKKDNGQSIETLNAEKSRVRPQGAKTFPKRPEADSKRIEFQRRSRIRNPVVKILNSENFVYAHNGNFHYSYDSQDGTMVSSEGKQLRNDKNEGVGEAVIGSVSYKDDAGKDYSFSYTADENGYRPIGAHLPTPPPIPPEIARALEHLATKKPDLATDY